MKKNRKKYILIIILLFISLTIGVLFINNTPIVSSVFYLVNKISMGIVETEDYKNGFIETSYKNYTILHNKDVEPALPIIFTYLDELELKSNDLLGFIPKEKVTIQIDYDKNVFNARNSIGESINEAAGYYNPILRTIYINSEDPYNDIIMNMSEIENLSDGSILKSKTSFKEVLFHEYAHYMFSSFISENGIDESAIPIWFKEGIAEYIACANKSTGKELDFISLNNLKTNKDWIVSYNESDNTDIYIESMYAIYKILNLCNENDFYNIIIKCNKQSFDKSLKDVIGVSLDDFDNILRNDFSNYNEMYDEVNSLVTDYTEIKIKCLEEYIKQNKNDIRAYQTLITYYENNRGFNETLNFLQELTEKYPNESIFWRRLAILYENNNMIDLANECYLKEKNLIEK